MHFYDMKKRLEEVLGDFYNPTVALIKILVIIILAILLVRVGSFVIRKLFQKQKSFKYKIDVKKVDTMSTLTVSVFRYTIYIIALVTILTDVFHLNSVLAAAGIGGVAVGFGAQSLIKDIISGFFIVMEDQYVVGDLVTIENLNGTVEEMELRVTKLRNFNGDLYIIPNGEIKKVTNHTRGNKAIIVDIPLAYNVDINKAFRAATEVCETVTKEFDSIIEAPAVLGITELGKSAVNMRIMGKALPNTQWEVERRIRRLIKERFDCDRIEFYDRNFLVSELKRLEGGEGTNAR